MKKVKGNLKYQLQGNVNEDVGQNPVLENFLQFEVLLVSSEELMVLVYHDHTNYDVAEGYQTSGQDGEQESDHYCDLVEVHKNCQLGTFVEVVCKDLSLKFLGLLFHRLGV